MDRGGSWRATPVQVSAGDVGPVAFRGDGPGCGVGRADVPGCASSMIDALGDLLADGGFRGGLVLGLLASVGLALGGGLARPLRRRAGLALTVAAVVGLAVHVDLPAGFAVGLAVLGTTGWLTARRRAATQVVAALPGAVILARSIDLDGGPAWVRPSVVAAVAVGGVLVASFDGADRRGGLSPLLVAVSALGAYVTTPDTEHVVVLAGAALPVALLAWWRPPLSLGPVGSVLTVAVFTWAVAVDGAARSSAVVGGIACLGLLVVAPLVRRRPRPGAVSSGGPAIAAWGTAGVLVLHVAVVVVCARVAGLRPTAAPALAISLLAHAAAAGALLWLGARQPRSRAS